MATSRRRTFEQQDPTKGNFRAYKNLSSDPENRNPPAFTGRIALPGNAEERSFSLWAATSRSTGNLILSGPVTPTRAQQWAQLSRKEGEQSPDAAKYVTMKRKQRHLFTVRECARVCFLLQISGDIVTQAQIDRAPPDFFTVLPAFAERIQELLGPIKAGAFTTLWPIPFGFPPPNDRAQMSFLLGDDT